MKAESRTRTKRALEQEDFDGGQREEGSEHAGDTVPKEGQWHLIFMTPSPGVRKITSHISNPMLPPCCCSWWQMQQCRDLLRCEKVSFIIYRQIAQQPDLKMVQNSPVKSGVSKFVFKRARNLSIFSFPRYVVFLYVG